MPTYQNHPVARADFERLELRPFPSRQEQRAGERWREVWTAFGGVEHQVLAEARAPLPEERNLGELVVHRRFVDVIDVLPV
jgi:hypothetical protein